MIRPASGGPTPNGATLPLTGPAPAGSRTVVAGRRVGLGDVHPSGSARLDALARYLQDVAADDVREAGADEAYRWVVRRTALEVVRCPVYGEPVELTTWCSGLGAAWAERRTTLVGERGARVEVASLWVALDPERLRPAPLGGEFLHLYGPATAGRTVRSRLTLPAVPGTDAGRVWPLRDADFDLFDHLNNAVALAAVEEAVARLHPGRPVVAAEVEYRSPVESRADLDIRERVSGPGGAAVWLIAGGEVAVVAQVTVGGAGNASAEALSR